MDEWQISTVIWPLAAVQFVGLCSACLTRYCEDCRCAAICRRSFFALLSLVGAATMAVIAVSPGLCLYSGTMLAIMMLTAIWDVDRAAPVSAGL
jgi:hypothetical protein